MSRPWDYRKDPLEQYERWRDNLNKVSRRQTWLLNTYMRYGQNPAAQVLKEYRSNARFIEVCFKKMRAAAKAMLD